MHSGASVNVVTKSGTNLFHGDLFEFFRNHRFNATNPFNAIDPATGERQGDGLNRNQYGGTLGGPIATDRLFFFGALPGHAGARDTGGPLRVRADGGDAGGRLHAVRVGAVQRDRRVNLRAPFVNNRVDPARFSPAALEHRRAAARRRPTRAAASPTAAAVRRTKRSTSARSTCS